MTSATYSCDTRGRLRQDRPWPATYPLPLIATSGSLDMRLVFGPDHRHTARASAARSPHDGVALVDRAPHHRVEFRRRFPRRPYHLRRSAPNDRVTFRGREYGTHRPGDGAILTAAHTTPRRRSGLCWWIMTSVRWRNHSPLVTQNAPQSTVLPLLVVRAPQVTLARPSVSHRASACRL